MNALGRINGQKGILIQVNGTRILFHAMILNVETCRNTSVKLRENMEEIVIRFECECSDCLRSKPNLNSYHPIFVTTPSTGLLLISPPSPAFWGSIPQDLEKAPVRWLTVKAVKPPSKQNSMDK